MSGDNGGSLSECGMSAAGFSGGHRAAGAGGAYCNLDTGAEIEE